MDRAYAARTRPELDALVDDLPGVAPSPPPATADGTGWRARLRRIPTPALVALGVLLATLWTVGAFAFGSSIGDPNPGWGPGHGPGYAYGDGWDRPGWGPFPFPFPFPIVPLLVVGLIVARFARRRRGGRIF
jgi:hypothetical protein